MNLYPYFFTFGMGQTILAKSYVRVEAPTEDAARQLMSESFGNKWAFCYTEKQFLKQPEEYGLKCLADVSVDDCCNLLARRA